MDTGKDSYPTPRTEVESARFVDAHDIPEEAVFVGKFADEYSPTDASAVYEVEDRIYVKTPVEAQEIKKG